MMSLAISPRVCLLPCLLIAGTTATGLAQAPSEPAPQIEIFAGLSANADYIANRQAILVADQKVSPFFGHGSGIGFQVSVRRSVRNGLGIKVDLSGYSDIFPPGPAAFCQPAAAEITCGTGLTFHAKGRALYLTAGPEWKFRRDKRFVPFAQVLAGIVSTRSTFEMSGSDVQYASPFTGGVLLFTSAGFQQARSITYSDSMGDVGVALAIGGGFDVRLGKSLSMRTALDYDPTFLVRPALPDLTPDAQGRVGLPRPMEPERHRQEHLRMSVGIVWHLR